MKKAFEEGEKRDGYCIVENPHWPTSNGRMCPRGKNRDIVWRYIIEWENSEKVNYNFQMGVDFGHGAAIFVDGKEFYYDRSNLWWNANWNAGPAVLKVAQDYDPGRHKIEIYGVEDCCDGNFNVRFEKNGNTGWLPMSKFPDATSDIDRSTDCWDIKVETRHLVNKLNKQDPAFG